MGFGFEREDRDLRSGLVRITREEVARARAEIAEGAGTLGPDRIVHQARKRTKRLRGLLRMVRPAFPDYADEAARLSRAARGLSSLRDRDVMIATHDRLMAATGADRRPYAAVRAHLTRARNRVAAEHDAAAALSDYAARMEALARRSADWRLDGKHFGGKDARALRAGLMRTWRHARAAMDRARAGTDIEDLHTWRKRVKDHWYQIRLLRAIAPDELNERARRVGELGEILGDIHDLDVYRHHLEGPEASGINPQRRAELVALSGARIDAMTREAFALAEGLFDLPAKPAAKALTTQWRAWRRGDATKGMPTTDKSVTQKATKRKAAKRKGQGRGKATRTDAKAKRKSRAG